MLVSGEGDDRARGPTRHPRSTLARVSPEHRGMRNLNETEQAALFVEFLRWKEQQSAVDSNAAAESLRGTIAP
jgi:hypothetical protein